jgi:enoyl-CoA hydratase
VALVEYEVRGRIAYITLNRPDKLNAVNAQVFEELVSVCERYTEDHNAWAGILSGRGRAFCTGHDLAETGQTGGRARSADETYFSLITTRKPLIAAVHGYCLAQGTGMALACDMVVAAENTRFGWPQVKRGISSVSGPALGVFFLPRKFAYQYLLTGRLFDAHEAYRLNLVNMVVPEGRLMPVAEEMAQEISENAPLAVQGMKQAMLMGLDVPLRQQMQISAEILRRVQGTEDAKEGIQAFLEKREPRFVGK